MLSTTPTHPKTERDWMMRTNHESFQVDLTKANKLVLFEVLNSTTTIRNDEHSDLNIL